MTLLHDRRMRGFDGGNVRKPVRPLATAMENDLAAALAPLDAWATT